MHSAHLCNVPGRCNQFLAPATFTLMKELPVPTEYNNPFLRLWQLGTKPITLLIHWHSNKINCLLFSTRLPAVVPEVPAFQCLNNLLDSVCCNVKLFQRTQLNSNIASFWAISKDRRDRVCFVATLVMSSMTWEHNICYASTWMWDNFTTPCTICRHCSNESYFTPVALSWASQNFSVWYVPM
jgi:hypothetical protein